MINLKELDKAIDAMPDIEFIPHQSRLFSLRWELEFLTARKRKRGRMLRKKWKQEKENGKK